MWVQAPTTPTASLTLTANFAGSRKRGAGNRGAGRGKRAGDLPALPAGLVVSTVVTETPGKAAYRVRLVQSGGSAGEVLEERLEPSEL